MRNLFGIVSIAIRATFLTAAAIAMIVTVFELSKLSAHMTGYPTNKTEWRGYKAYKNVIEPSALLNGKNSSTDEDEQNWTIIMTLNNGYLDFFLNWLAAYKLCHLTIPIVVISEDSSVYQELQNLRTNFSDITVFKSDFRQIKNAVMFGSKAFNVLSVRRHTYILDYLKAGKNIIFSDIDTVWIKSPIPYFTGNYDIWMQYDNPEVYCPGTMAVVSNNASIQFFKQLTKGLERNPQADQPYINKLIRRTKIRVHGLSNSSFPSGRQYFTEFTPKQRSDVVVVHNNWIKSHKSKLERFKKYNLWFVNMS